MAGCLITDRRALREGDPDAPKLVAKADWFEAPALSPSAGSAPRAEQPKPTP